MSRDFASRLSHLRRFIGANVEGPASFALLCVGSRTHDHCDLAVKIFCVIL